VADDKQVTMTRGRVRVLLIGAWTATILLLIYIAHVPPWLAFIGNLAGGVVIHNYAPPLSAEVLAPAEKVLRIGVYVVLYAVLAVFALIVVAITLGTLVTLLV
jgi:hypothetical protein